MDVPAERMLLEVERDGGVRDRVAIEEPLEIRVHGAALVVTMRTPGHDEELAAGWLWSEGLLAGPPESIGPPPELEANIVDVHASLVSEPRTRRFVTASSCGVCGLGAIEDVAVIARVEPPPPDAPRVSRALLADLPSRLAQPAFAASGGLHATGLFSADGELLLVREDVGRHNALDKVVGRALLDGALPLRDRLLCVSGRLSFELVQKAALAGCPVLVGVGAPSSLAVDLARERGMTLAGFARGGRVNVYAGAQRVAG